MPATARQLVGREAELAAIVRLLDAREQLPGAVVVPGDAGIGKTALWLASLDAATARGYRVLSSRPAEAETRFSFAGLADLLGKHAVDVVPELPPVQQRALEAALLLGESEIHADDRAVAAAFLGALRLLVEDGPLCLGVDDVQWLDAAPLAALQYALARLDDEPVATLLAVRGRPPAWLRRAVPEERLREIEVVGLGMDTIRKLLRVRLDATFPRPTLIKIWETSGGNPYFALELGGALQRSGGTLAPGEELPIPSDLDELLNARIDDLSAAALEIARAVAALADPTVQVVESAVGRRFDPGLAEALAARIVELDGERLRFTHPLLRSVVAARQPPSRRRSMHARLAKIVPIAEERARHLALATAEPTSEIAAILEDAARSADSRGAPGTAAELAEQSVRLTPLANGADARRRLLIAADRHQAAGDPGRATALLSHARSATAPGGERAAVLIQLAGIQGDVREAEALYDQAPAEASEADALEAMIHLRLAHLMRFSEGVERGVAHAELAVRAASRVHDVPLRCRAIAAHGMLHFNAGRGIPRAEMDEALRLERSLPEAPLADGPANVCCHQLFWSDDLESARSLLHESREVLETRNDALGEAETRWYLGLVEWRAGNWEAARQYAGGSLELMTQLGRTAPSDEFPAVVIAAHQGQIAEARTRAHDAFARADAAGIRSAQSGHGWVLGFIELSLGQPVAALEHLRRSHELRNTFMHEPGMRLELGDLLEALIATGEFDESHAILATWEARAAALDRAWALAILARGRALLLAAQGDLVGAFAHFERALAEHARSTDPFHHARTLLALGRTQRRAKKRGAARATLEDALERFQRLGAPLWAEQTQVELARIGGRAPSRGALTEAERRIAKLVAEGRTNREVAAALFLTEHSVEAALTRIYSKLGVRSRAELAHLHAANA